MEKKNKISGAEAVIQSLIAENVETVFGYPGGAIMPIYDALYDYTGKLNHVLVRHEQGAIHAAQGYARVSQKIGVCFATSGPGATNLITGLADALIDSTPVVCITGQVASKLLGTDAFQEIDVIGISNAVTKWNIQVRKAADIPNAIAKAFFIARSGRPGPVLIDITKDAQMEEMSFNYSKCTEIKSFSKKPCLDFNKIQQATKLIDSAQKPLLLIGQGVILSRADKELLLFIEKTGIPVASTLLGLGALPTDHPQYVGFLGMHGNYAPNIMINECDVLIGIGLRFDDRVTGDVARFAKQAKIIHIDLDFSELNKIIKVNVALHADAKEALLELIKETDKRKHTAWLNEFKKLKEVEYQAVIKNEIFLQKEGLNMAEVVHLLSEKTNGEAIVVTDVGQHQMVTARYYGYKKSKSNVTSGGLGTMGFALPAAIGAKIACPNRTVIAIIGDGGFQMTLQELGTILQFNVDVKIVVLNNNFLGMVRQWQQMFFDKRYSCTEIVNPNFITIAQGYEITGSKISNRFELEDAIDVMLNHKGAYLLEVVVEKEENVFPMIPAGASVSEIRLK